MKNNLMLTITSLLSILLMTLHRDQRYHPRKVGTPEAGGSTLCWGTRSSVWLFGALVLAERRSGPHHHARRVAPCAGHACRPRDGSGRRF